MMSEMIKGKADMAKNKTKKDTALAELIAAAPAKALSELILNLAENDPEIRRECFDYLKKNTAVSKMLKRRSEGEAIMSIWAELLPDLEDLDAYGGGPYGAEESVWELLYEITKRLTSKKSMKRIDVKYSTLFYRLLKAELRKPGMRWKSLLMLPVIPLLNCGTLPKAWKRCMMTGKPAMPATFIGRSGTVTNTLSFG